MSAFWDASAVVRVSVKHQASVRARPLLDAHAPAVWWGTPVEVRSALVRLKSEGVLSEPAYQACRRKLAAMLESWLEIGPTDVVRELALDVLDRFTLKAADALQLAAALAWCRQRPKGRLFVSSDSRLSAAASQAGFEIASI